MTKVWVTKWAMTKGILTGTVNEYTPEEMMRVMLSGEIFTVPVPARFVFYDEQLAIKHAEAKRDDEVAATRRKLQRLLRLNFREEKP